MSESKTVYGMGWLPDYPDFRDFTADRANIKAQLAPTGVTGEQPSVPERVDLREWCSPIENQLTLGSCTAHAAAGLVEYYEKRAFAKYIDASRLFLYKVTRNLLQWTGDTGAFLRHTMGAMVLFGVPPEEYWPYKIEAFDTEPPAFCYAFAENFKAIQYVRLDPPDVVKKQLLEKIKTFLAAGLPAMFGFTVYRSYVQATLSDCPGCIPLPCNTEKIVGGHAVMAAGYDDKKVIKNADCGLETTGALLIRNSWGTGWGEAGYGWLPYQYVTMGLAVDWWTLTKQDWIDTGQFQL